MKLHFRKYGAGPPLIILHGLFGSLNNWHSHAVWFGERFTVYAVDLRNHGHSPHADLQTYDAMASDVVQLLQDEGIISAHLLGHSMGGKVAMEVAGRHPHLVSRLAVVDIAPRSYEERHNAFLEAMESLSLDESSSRDDIDVALAVMVPDSRVRQFLLTNLRRTVHGFEWKLNLKAIRENYAEIMGESNREIAFQGPTLFLRGGRSEYLREDDMPLIRRMFPNVRFATIPEAGHWVHAEVPEEFRRVIMEFLLDLAGG